MTTEPAHGPYPADLLEQWVARAGLSLPRLACIVSLGLIAFVLIAAHLDGELLIPLDFRFLRAAAVYPALIAYSLLIEPSQARLRDAALEALKPLVAADDDEFQKLVAREPLFDRRNQLLAIGVGMSVVLLGRPWEVLDSWLGLYQIVAGTLLYGLLGLIVYTSAASTRLGADWDILADINVFELGRLQPVARCSLGTAMAFIGGITLSLLLLPEFSLDIVSVATYGVLSAAAVLVFFVNMMTTHPMMVAVKERELGMIRHRLAVASRALNLPERDSQVDRMLALADLSLWRAYEKQVDELPEWPYTDEIRRSLLVSLLLPLAAYLIPALLLEAARSFLFRP